MAKLTMQTRSHLGIVVQKKRERKGYDSEGVRLFTIQPFAWEKKRFAQMFTDGRTDGRRTMAYSSFRLGMS